MNNASCQKLEVFPVQGTVVEVTKDSETIISGGGGGGSISTSPNGYVSGNISGISIGSETLKQTTIWIKTEEDREISVTFDGNVNARQGHKITFICVRDPRDGSTIVSRLINHTTNRNATFVSNKMVPLSFGYGNAFFRPRYESGFIVALLIVLGGSLAMQVMFPMPTAGTFVLCVLILGVPTVFYKLRKLSKWKINDQMLAKKNDEIESLCNEISSDLDTQVQKLLQKLESAGGALQEA